MRKRLSTILFSTALLSAGAVDAKSHFPAPVRTVELITVAGAEQPTASGQSPDPVQPQLRVNDLSRRLVEFRMAQEFASPTAVQEVVGPVFPPMPRIATASSIAAPPWMRGTMATPATMAFAPGCGSSVYHPSGFLPAAAEARRFAYYGMMSAVACEHGIPTGLFDAMILRESGYDPAALSTKRAFGFAQLMPDTAVALGVNRYDPLQNMRGGARYLRQQLDRFGRVELALAAYNAGPGRVRGGMVPGITETQAYVSAIIANWRRLARTGPQAEVIASR